MQPKFDLKKTYNNEKMYTIQLLWKIKGLDGYNRVVDEGFSRM